MVSKFIPWLGPFSLLPLVLASYWTSWLLSQGTPQDLQRFSGYTSKAKQWADLSSWQCPYSNIISFECSGSTARVSSFHVEYGVPGHLSCCSWMQHFQIWLCMLNFEPFIALCPGYILCLNVILEKGDVD